MRGIVSWTIRNQPAMNTMVIAILLVGAMAFASMRREVFPEFELEIVLVTVPYPGATPDEVEEGICQKIEEACRSVEGIKKVTSVAQEGAGFCVFELRDSVKDVQKTLTVIRSEVDRIPSFPELAEDPKVEQITLRTPAIKVGVLAPEPTAFGEVSEEELRDVAEAVRDDLLSLPAVSAANLQGARDYEIDIEISEATLRKYGLSLQSVAEIVRRENLELPGGLIRGESGEILLRGKNKRYTGEEIAKLPLVTLPDGLVLTVGDLATVRDEFADVASTNQINGRPGMVVSVDRTSSEDLLAMVAAVKGYVAEASLPPGYELVTWADQSVDVRDRLDMLVSNGLQGLLIVFVVLALFLDLKIAFWVALGIPFSMLGTGMLMFTTDQTLNMLSMFAFLMAIGIVVDDAVVVSDNIERHRRMGKSLVQAAIDGTVEVIPSVTSSVMTTVITFMPLCFVSGVMGKFIAVMPFAFISSLLMSLVESTLVLPGHLAHEKSLVFTILALMLIDSLGRRPLLVGGMAVVAATLAVIGGLFQGIGPLAEAAAAAGTAGEAVAAPTAAITPARGLAIGVAICIYMAAIAFSICAVIWVLTPEIFPNRVRARAVSICTLANWATNFLGAFAFPWVVERFGMAAAFLAAAGICTAATAFFFTTVPETKGRSLEAIEAGWAGR